MNRRILVLAIWTISAVGIAFAATPLIASWFPGPNARAKLVELDDGGMPLNTFRTIDCPTFRFYILRVSDSPRVFYVPTHKGTVWMPDLTWLRGLAPCRDFGPDHDGAALLPGAIFRCHDPDTPGWWASKWRWTLDGKAIPNPETVIDDLLVAATVVEGKRLLVKKPSCPLTTAWSGS